VYTQFYHIEYKLKKRTLSLWNYQPNRDNMQFSSIFPKKIAPSSKSSSKELPRKEFRSGHTRRILNEPNDGRVSTVPCVERVSRAGDAFRMPAGGR